MPWLDIGAAIADALTFGLASKLPAIGGALSRGGSVRRRHGRAASAVRAKNVIAMPPGKPVAGHRRNGGSVEAGKRYVVGEAGEGEFVPGRSGTIIPHLELQRRRAAKGGDVHIHGGIHITGEHDPEATACTVRRELQRIANGQAAYLSD